MSIIEDLFDSPDRNSNRRLTRFLDDTHAVPELRDHYSVTYGDCGWDYEPGTEHASLEEAVTDIQQAISDLNEMLNILKEIDDGD